MTIASDDHEILLKVISFFVQICTLMFKGLCPGICFKIIYKGNFNVKPLKASPRWLRNLVTDFDTRRKHFLWCLSITNGGDHNCNNKTRKVNKFYRWTFLFSFHCSLFLITLWHSNITKPLNERQFFRPATRQTSKFELKRKNLMAKVSNIYEIQGGGLVGRGLNEAK